MTVTSRADNYRGVFDTQLGVGEKPALGKQQNSLPSFATLHGLSELKPIYLKRMEVLSVPVATFGQQVRRLSNKEDGHAPVFVVMTRT